MNLSKSEVDKLKIAMLLYDIGNTMMPKEIMKKAAPLNNKEKEAIQKHPVVGAQEILKPINSVSNIIPIIEHHHENWDGSGYPNNRKGEEIPLTSQIILIVDSYFAMISYRPYRKAYTIDEAIEEIKSNSNKKYMEQIRIAKEIIHNRKHSPKLKSFVKGLMIESYLEDGAQKVGEGIYGKSITDPCIGWTATEELIKTIYDYL